MWGCASKPPPDLAPPPGLLSRIRSVEIDAQGSVCPGGRIEAWYYAVLDDGSRIPFSTRYDKDDPPELHVIMLRRSSPEATAREDGNWESDPDPAASVMRGFRLSAFLKRKPSLNAIASVAPDYGCVSPEFPFEGGRGRTAQSGGPGPDVVVRLAILRSPFYERLLVAAVDVGAAPPFYVFADADRIPPADWLRVESRGGRGGSGISGRGGAPGEDGAAGCPGSAGGPGGPGGDGGDGATGGPGARILVMVPEEDPFLAGLVEARAPGGRGGPGGGGGEGGSGGKGGSGEGRGGRCQAGPDGPGGTDGERGRVGREGSPGPRAGSMVVAGGRVFDAARDWRIADLIEYAQGDG